MVEHHTVNQGDSGLSEETLKAGGPFYLVSMPSEVRDPTPVVNV